MRIVQLNAENVKRLRAVEITPDENVVVIAGRNAQGKTSVLDAIWLALGGGSASKETTRVIRDGEEEAHVTLDLGDFTVTRTWKGGKSSLSVFTQDGAKYDSPQTFLNERLGALSFDPLAFAQDEPKKQLATLLGLVELPFDPDELAAQRRAIFDQRTEKNRALADAKARLSHVPKFPVFTPDEDVDTKEIAQAQVQYEADYAAASDYERLLNHRRNNVELGAARITKMIAELEQAKRDYDTDVDKLDEHASAPVAFPERVDLHEALAKVEATNADVRAKRDFRMGQAEVSVVQVAVDELTAALAGIDDYKAEMLREAKMPIEGLGFDDDGVTYQGVPFKQASGAEQLRVSVAMAMAMNPTIRVIRISDGSLLDRENMAILAEMAGDNDFQVWIERVDEDGGVGFTIEDGEVVGVDGAWTRSQELTGAWTRAQERAEATGFTRVSPNTLRESLGFEPVRMSMCTSCGETKVADPTSRYFTARPDSDMDFDWDGCSAGSGT